MQGLAAADEALHSNCLRLRCNSIGIMELDPLAINVSNTFRTCPYIFADRINCISLPIYAVPTCRTWKGDKDFSNSN